MLRCELRAWHFFIAKILEDCLPLLEDIEEKNADSENVLDNIHLLFTNLHAFENGKKILMWEDIEDEDENIVA